MEVLWFFIKNLKESYEITLQVLSTLSRNLIR